MHKNSKQHRIEGEFTGEEKKESSESSTLLRRVSWQDWAFLGFFFASSLFVLSMLLNMKQLPGPLYGGDVYFHFGNVMHLFDGGSIFRSSHYMGEWQHYPWLLYAAIFLFGKIFMLSPMRAAILFPTIIFALSLVVNYFLGQRIFQKKEIALLFSIGSAAIPISTPTSLETAVLLPLSLFAYFLYGNNSELKRELLRKYNIRYLYLDYYSADAAIQCNELWDNFSNPQYHEYSYSCMRVLPEYQQYLKDNGILTKEVYARLDIAFTEAPSTNLTIIKPTPALLNLTLLSIGQYQNQSILRALLHKLVGV